MEDSDRQLLKANRMDIAQDLDVNSATSYLYSKSIFTENDRDEILALRTQQSKSEKLLDILPRRGPEAFGVFVKFLEEKQNYLVPLLKPQTGQQGSKQPVDNLDSSGPPSSDMKPVVESGEEMKPNNSRDSTKRPHCCSGGGEVDGFGSRQPKEDGPDQADGGRSSRLNLKSSTYKDGFTPEYMYPMTHNPRGQAFIINNKTFLPASGMQKYPRNGTDVDAEALYKLFRALKFDTHLYHNRTSREINNIFEYYAGMNHSNYDCIMCAILTHGEEGLIYSTDGKIQIKELTSKFRSKNLLGIPKLFFFQACQGFEYMDGVDQTDYPRKEEPVDEVDAPGNNKITLPIEADFLYAYSTVPGYYSWRNSVRGSWFVQAIVDVFQKNAMTMDVLRMMTRVNAEVAKQKSNTNEYFSDNKKQIPSIISQLRKELYFFPENVLENDDNTDATKPANRSKREKDCAVC